MFLKCGEGHLAKFQFVRLVFVTKKPRLYTGFHHQRARAHIQQFVQQQVADFSYPSALHVKTAFRLVSTAQHPPLNAG